jgi:hypothetical protein
MHIFRQCLNPGRHCFVIEDGVERYNSFVKNLGAFVSMPKKTVNGDSDYAPSVFWITNTMNSYVGNVAAGSDDSGYWFELFKRGIKADRLTDLEPSREPLLRFENNVAHSIRGVGVIAHSSDSASHLNCSSRFVPIQVVSRHVKQPRFTDFGVSGALVACAYPRKSS